MTTCKALQFAMVLTGKKMAKFNWVGGGINTFPSQTANFLNAEAAFDSNSYFCRNKFFNKCFLN